MQFKCIFFWTEYGCHMIISIIQNSERQMELIQSSFSYCIILYLI